jgi:hypothetical protein
VKLRSLVLPALTLLALVAACGQPQRIGTNVLFPCSHPKPDTTGWKRIAGPYPGYTILVPAGLQRAGGSGPDALWGDGSRSVRIFRRAWGSAQFQDPAASHADYSSCWTHVAGVRTYLVIRRLDNGYQVTGWYRRGSSVPASAGPLDGVVSGAAGSPRDQAVFLRMIESLRAE